MASARKSARFRTRAIAQVLDGAGGCPADRRRDLDGAALRDHDPGRARAFGAAADGAEVLRVLDLVQRHDQRLLGVEQAAGVGVGVRLGLADDALMVG